VNLAHIIDDHAGDSVALIYRGRATTYGELRDQVARVRGGLRSLGVESGDRVALLLSNSPQFVVGYLATVGLGAVAVPLNPTSPGPELENELGVVGAKVVIVDKVSSVNWSHVDPAVVPTVQAVVHTEAAPEGGIGFDDLVASSEPLDVIDVEPAHLAVLMFTSGTAGAPRAAMLTHGNLWANLDQSLSAEGHINSDDVI
jgi:long-chain acyl-CoA synthetase